MGIAVATNSAGFQSATVTIGGQNFNVTQSASACGGTDVSSQVQVTRRALLDQWNYNNSLTQQLQLVNNGPVIPGPVSVVLYGICTQFFCPFANGFSYTRVQCQAGQLSFLEPAAVLVAPNGLAANQTLISDLPFYANPYQPPPNSGPPTAVTISVISGTPGAQ